MSNVNTVYDVDDALASWERIKAEEAEEHKRKTILKDRINPSHSPNHSPSKLQSASAAANF